MVRNFHEALDELSDDTLTLYAVLHVIVENQIAEKVELIPETIEKLIRQALDRHDAIHAIASIVCDDIFYFAQGNKK